MRWFWQQKPAEIDENEPEIDIEARFKSVDDALKEISLIVTRIEQRHYKAKAKQNGDLSPDPDALPDDFSWMRKSV